MGGKVLPGDENQDWREEAFGERPVLDPLGNPFHDDTPIEVCGLENPESCDACQ